MKVKLEIELYALDEKCTTSFKAVKLIEVNAQPLIGCILHLQFLDQGQDRERFKFLASKIDNSGSTFVVDAIYIYSPPDEEFDLKALCAPLNEDNLEALEYLAEYLELYDFQTKRFN